MGSIFAALFFYRALQQQAFIRRPFEPGYGACRYLNWLLGLSIIPLGLEPLLIPVPLLLFVTGLTLLSEGESGNPSRKILFQSGIFQGFSWLATLGLIFYFSAQSLLPWVFLVAVSIYFIQVLLPVWQDFQPPQVRSAIKRLVMGVIIVDALMVTVHGLPFWSVCILLLLLPGKMIGRWLYVS